MALALAEDDNAVLVAGYTLSTDFPTTPDALYSTYGGNIDGFLTKLLIDAGPPISSGQDWRVECPFCSVANSQGIIAGINTRTGTYAYAAAPLQLNTLVQPLAFQYGYISAATDLYTTTMSYGWTHNFDMQLDFETTVPTHTVVFKAPGGSRFPYYGNGDGTYIPYAGVTAQLERFDGTYPEDTQYVMTTFNQLSFTFNYQGKLVFAADSAGNTYYLTYDGNGLLYRAYQGTRYLEYDYDGEDRLWHVEDHAGRIVTLEYDGVTGDLISVTDPLNRTTEYVYDDDPHLLTEIIDPSGRTYHLIAYDEEHRAYRLWDGNGNLLVDITFDQGLGLLSNDDLSTVSRVVYQGVVMTHTYGTRGTLVDSTNGCNDGTPGCGANTAAGFDYHFNHNYVEDANGNPTALTWSGNGSNVEQAVDALNNHTALTYDTFNNLTQVVNAQGYTTTYYFDNSSFPTFRTRQVNSLNQTTYYTPTINGLLSAVRTPDGMVTRHWYNDYGQVTQTVHAYGTSEAITTTYGYDTIGRQITTTQVVVGQGPLTTLNVYDDANQLIATIRNWTGTNPSTWENECITTSGPRDSNVCTRYGYDAAGRAISTTNTLGQTDLSFYDAAGRLFLRVGNYDGTPSYASDPVGVLCDWTAPDPEDNLCTMTSYDGYGRVVSTTNVLGKVDRTFYDSLGRVQATVVNSVNVTDDWEECDFPPASPDEDLCTVYTYDAAGNVVEVKDPVGQVTLTVYNELNRVEGTIVNWDGDIDLDDCYTSTWLNQRERDENVCSRHQYDELGNTLIVSDTLGHMTRAFYDALGRAEGSIRNWDGTIDLDDCWTGSLSASRDDNICSGYIYDGAGNQTVITNTLGQMNLTVYDVAQRPTIQVTNWDGTSTTWPDDCADTVSDPDATENLCTFTSYDSLGRRASTTDAMGHVTEFTYDGLGRVVTTTRYLDGQPVESVVAYDALGNQLTRTDSEGHTTTTIYDSLNRPVVTISHEGVAITTTYNAASWITGTVNNLGHTTANDYDALGRLVVTTDGEDHDTAYGYDALGNQVIMTDALGVEMVYSYDELNRLITVIENKTANDPDYENNLLTQYRYDVLGNRVVITNALNITTALTLYDDLNRPISVKDALGNETEYQYNVLGQRTVMTDANGDITLYSYDDLNRLDTVSYETDNETVEYVYDALGNRIIMTDSLGVATYEYDDFSRVITVTSPLTGTVIYGYDSVGNWVELTYPNGYTVTYQYDGDNRLVEVEDWEEGVTTYEYDPAGRLITTTLPHGVVTVNTYDDTHRLINLTHEDGDSNLVASYTYVLDDVGNRIVATETMRLPVHTLQETQTSPTTLPLETNEEPAIAYNSNDNEYLVVWQGYNDNELNWVIYGQRVDSVGNLVGSVITITIKATEPDVAYNPTDEVYMVVFSQEGEIGAQLVNTDGTITESPITLPCNSAACSQPSVAYNLEDNTFSAAYINYDASVSMPPDPPIETYTVYAYKISEHSPYLEYVESQSSELRSPALAITEAGLQLVVWQYHNGSDWDVYGHMLASDGTASGDVIEIADNSDNEMTPDVAWSETAEAFLVVWHNHGGFIPQGVQGRRVLDDGTLTGSIVLYSDTNTTSYPAVTATPTDWWIVWQQGSSAVLYGQQVSSNGIKEGDNTLFFASSDNRTKPALTGGNVDGSMLLAWEDDRDSEYTIYHAVINTGSVTTTTIAYTYDPVYRLVEADYSGTFSGAYSYTYDEVGNRLTFSTNITQTQNVTYTYNLANELVLSVDQDGITTTYQWDDAGRLITTTVDGQVARIYEYNQHGALITATVNGVTTTFAYDGDDNRLLMSVAGQVTTYTLDYTGGGQILYELGGTFGSTKHYLYGQACIGEFADAAEPGNEWRYYQRDGRQMVRQTTDENANVSLAWVYTPDGTVLMGEQGPVTHLDCGSGAVYDWSTGLIFKNDKYFDPSTGIWLILPTLIIWQAGNPLKRRKGKRGGRRFGLSLFLILIASLALMGCQGGAGGETTPTPDCPERVVEQIWTTTYRPTPWYADGSGAEGYEDYDLFFQEEYAPTKPIDPNSRLLTAFELAFYVVAKEENLDSSWISEVKTFPLTELRYWNIAKAISYAQSHGYTVKNEQFSLETWAQSWSEVKGHYGIAYRAGATENSPEEVQVIIPDNVVVHDAPSEIAYGYPKNQGVAYVTTVNAFSSQALSYLFIYH